MDAAQLPGVLVDHLEWLQDASRGARAELNDFDLEGVQIPCGVDLREAHISGASLVRCNFEEADLRAADLRFSDLRDASFVRANLAGANLGGVRNMTPRQLAAANLSGATLSDEEFFDDVFDLDWLTSTIAKLLTSVVVSGVALLLYAWTAPDASLIVNSPAKQNPVSSIELPFLAFGVLGPAAMFVTYLILQIHLQRLWERLGAMPAVFPDGRSLADRLRFSVGVAILREKTRPADERSQPLAPLEYLLTVFALWWFVPLVTVSMWWRYLVCHDERLSALHAVLVAANIVLAWSTHELASSTLTGSVSGLWASAADNGAFRVSSGNDGVSVPIGVRHGVLAFPVFALTVTISVLCTQWGWPAADVTGAQLSTLPSDISQKDVGSASDELLQRVRGARLFRHDLRNAHASEAFLVNADLRHTNLSGVNFCKADLRFADLSGAVVDDATNFKFANVRGAKGAPASHVVDGFVDGPPPPGAQCP